MLILGSLQFCLLDVHPPLCQTRARDSIVSLHNASLINNPFILASVHRFSHSTMPAVYILRKYVVVILSSPQT